MCESPQQSWSHKNPRDVVILMLNPQGLTNPATFSVQVFWKLLSVIKKKKKSEQNAVG